MKVYFSAEQISFIPAEWKDDGTYTEDTWPADAVLLDDKAASDFWKQSPPEGKVMGSENGLPIWVDLPPQPAPTRDDIESLRLRAYAEPLTGSDRLFSEAMRMQIMSETGYQDVRARAIARFEEIQAQYPWPAE